MMELMQDQNEAHSRKDFDSKPKKKKFCIIEILEKKILEFFSAIFFFDFFQKKDSCDHVFWDKKLNFGFVVHEPYSLRSVKWKLANFFFLYSLCLWDVWFILGKWGIDFLCFGPIFEIYGKRSILSQNQEWPFFVIAS